MTQGSSQIRPTNTSGAIQELPRLGLPQAVLNEWHIVRILWDFGRGIAMKGTHLFV